jgi:hypothetical protein
MTRTPDGRRWTLETVISLQLPANRQRRIVAMWHRRLRRDE